MTKLRFPKLFTVAFVVSTLLIGCASEAASDLTEQDFVGEWSAQLGEQDITLRLEPDGAMYGEGIPSKMFSDDLNPQRDDIAAARAVEGSWYLVPLGREVGSAILVTAGPPSGSKTERGEIFRVAISDDILKMTLLLDAEGSQRLTFEKVP